MGTAAAVTIFVVGVVAIAVAVAIVTVRRGRSGATRAREGGHAEWRRRALAACREAFVIVDLATPAAPEAALPTSELSSLGQRISQLDERLEHLRDPAVDGRLGDAFTELRQVARSLSSALEAGRSIRVEAGAPDQLQQSAARIAERTTELDMAARELSWLLDKDDLD